MDAENRGFKDEWKCKSFFDVMNVAARAMNAENLVIKEVWKCKSCRCKDKV